MNLSKNKNYKTSLLRIFPVLFIISLISVQSYAQSDSLSADTNTHHISFMVGGGLSVNPLNISSEYADTLTYWNPSSRSFFMFGFSFSAPLGRRWQFQSGVLLTIGSLYSSYGLSGKSDRKEQTNYSTLSLPLLFRGNFSDRPGCFFLKAGILPELDISKKQEKNERVFGIKTLSPSFYLSLGKQFKTEYTRFATEVFFTASLLNMLKNQESFYSSSLGSLRLFRTGILLSIN